MNGIRKLQFAQVELRQNAAVLCMRSADEMNRLTRKALVALTLQFLELSRSARAVVLTGNMRCFSAGADLAEIAVLNGPNAYEFSKAGQELMRLIEAFPAPVYAAISGYCMGGGLDLALACRYRIASPRAMFGHRGAALGLITGWGGTQRLPRLIGKGRALEMFIAAEKVAATRAFEFGLIDAIADDPVDEALRRIAGAQN